MFSYFLYESQCKESSNTNLFILLLLRKKAIYCTISLLVFYACISVVWLINWTVKDSWELWCVIIYLSKNTQHLNLNVRILDIVSNHSNLNVLSHFTNLHKIILNIINFILNFNPPVNRRKFRNCTYLSRRANFFQNMKSLRQQCMGFGRY